MLTGDQYRDLIDYWVSQPRGDSRQDYYNTLIRYQIVALLNSNVEPGMLLPPWHKRDEDGDMDAEELYNFIKDLNEQKKNGR